MKKSLLVAAVATIGILIWFGSSTGKRVEDWGFATRLVVDAAGPRAPWAKATGDINGDGLIDIIIGGHQGERPHLFVRALAKFGFMEHGEPQCLIAAYINPQWQKKKVIEGHCVRTDLELVDLDGDARMDVVALTQEGLIWFSGPDWRTPHVVEKGRFHDVEVADFNRDGKPDLLVRNQSLFGYGNGNQLLLYVQDAEEGWQKQVLSAPHGEGLKVADVDGDGFADIVVNQIWYRNPYAEPDSDREWVPWTYTDTYKWLDVYVDVVDVNKDGRVDILLAPSEPEGSRYRIAWFEQPDSSTNVWQEHVVEDDVESIHHFVGAGDFDGDGAVDIFAAEMNQGQDPDEVKVYLNKGLSWHKKVLGTRGSHSMKVADFDGDGDVELMGANWEFTDYQGDYEVSLWDAKSR